VNCVRYLSGWNLSWSSWFEDSVLEDSSLSESVSESSYSWLSEYNREKGDYEDDRLQQTQAITPRHRLHPHIQASQGHFGGWLQVGEAWEKAAEKIFREWRVSMMTQTRTRRGTNLPEQNLQTNLIKRGSIRWDIGHSSLFKTTTKSYVIKLWNSKVKVRKSIFNTLEKNWNLFTHFNREIIFYLFGGQD
jgi:hypothetical protein